MKFYFLNSFLKMSFSKIPKYQNTKIPKYFFFSKYLIYIKINEFMVYFLYYSKILFKNSIIKF